MAMTLKKVKKVEPSVAPKVPDDKGDQIGDPLTVHEIEFKDVVGVTEKTHSDGSVVSTQEILAKGIQKVEPMANVGVSMGMTKNIGDFSNVKFQASLYIPCHMDSASIDAAYEFGKAWVDAKVNAFHDEVVAQLGL